MGNTFNRKQRRQQRPFKTKDRLRQEIPEYWRHYLMQGSIAGVVLFIVFTILYAQDAVITASLAATTFIVFIRPRDETSYARHIIGGHFVGFFIGSLFTLIPHGESVTLFAYADTISTALVYALSITASILIMALTDTEHAPAAGTALGTVISGFQWEILLCLAIGPGILVAVKYYLNPYLRELV